MSSYDAQLMIRRDAEERSVAHRELGSWMDEVKSKKLQPKPAIEKKGALASKSMSLEDRKEATTNHESFDDERLQGNDFFARGEYGDAIQCYTRCLHEKEALSSPVVYSNRGKLFSTGQLASCRRIVSLCSAVRQLMVLTITVRDFMEALAYLKLKSWAQAEEDATSALQIDPLHFKSYQRRCVARLSMGKVRAAMVDVCSAKDSVLSMNGKEDGDKSATKTYLSEIQKLRAKVEKALVDAANRAPRRKLPMTIV